MLSMWGISMLATPLSSPVLDLCPSVEVWKCWCLPHHHTTPHLDACHTPLLCWTCVPVWKCQSVTQHCRLFYCRPAPVLFPIFSFCCQCFTDPALLCLLSQPWSTCHSPLHCCPSDTLTFNFNVHIYLDWHLFFVSNGRSLFEQVGSFPLFWDKMSHF